MCLVVKKKSHRTPGKRQIFNNEMGDLKNWLQQQGKKVD
jgi:hypothetical protein